MNTSGGSIGVGTKRTGFPIIFVIIIVVQSMDYLYPFMFMKALHHRMIDHQSPDLYCLKSCYNGIMAQLLVYWCIAAVVPKLCKDDSHTM